MQTNYRLIIFDVDSTLVARNSIELLPGRGEFFREPADADLQIALASNQGGVGFRHWLEMGGPPWFVEKSPEEQAIQLAVYPTQSEVVARLQAVAAAVKGVSGTWPASYASYAYQFKDGRWTPTPDGEQGNLCWSQEWRKPNPGMLVKAMNDFKVSPLRTLMIGDRDEDAAAATAAECMFVWTMDFFAER